MGPGVRLVPAEISTDGFEMIQNTKQEAQVAACAFLSAVLHSWLEQSPTAGAALGFDLSIPGGELSPQGESSTQEI